MRSQVGRRFEALGVGMLNRISLNRIKSLRMRVGRIRSEAETSGDERVLMLLQMGKIAGDLTMLGAGSYVGQVLVANSRWARAGLTTLNRFVTKRYKPVSALLYTKTAFDSSRAIREAQGGNMEAAMDKAVSAVISFAAGTCVLSQGLHAEKAASERMVGLCNAAQSDQIENKFAPDIEWKEASLESGERVYSLSADPVEAAKNPRNPKYHIRESTLKAAKMSRHKIHGHCQVKPRLDKSEPVRRYLQEYEVSQEVQACVGLAKSNAEYGIGGGEQIFVLHPEKLAPTGKFIELNDKPGGANLAPVAAALGVGSGVAVHRRGSGGEPDTPDPDDSEEKRKDAA